MIIKTKFKDGNTREYKIFQDVKEGAGFPFDASYMLIKSSIPGDFSIGSGQFFLRDGEEIVETKSP